MSKSSLGLNQNITAVLAYVFGWVSGLIILLLEKDNAYVRFHAMQSIVVFGSLSLLSVLILAMLLFFAFLIPLLNLFAIVLWVILMIKAYQGHYFKLPVAGDLAEKWVSQIKI